MQVQFGHTPATPTAQTPKFGGTEEQKGFFANLRDSVRGGSDTAELSSREGNLRDKGSVGKGIGRMLHKTFLRPRGWAELASLFVVPVPVFQIKHFVEGFMGYNSLFMQRKLKGPIEMMWKTNIHDKPLMEAMKK